MLLPYREMHNTRDDSLNEMALRTANLLCFSCVLLGKIRKKYEKILKKIQKTSCNIESLVL